MICFSSKAKGIFPNGSPYFHPGHFLECFFANWQYYFCYILSYFLGHFVFGGEEGCDISVGEDGGGQGFEGLEDGLECLRLGRC